MKFDTPNRNDDDSTTPTDAAADPPADRMAVHVIWELGLLLLAGGVLFALTRSTTGPFAEGSWTGFMSALAPVVLAATAAAVSLRVGAVNLAVGPIALLSAWMFVDASGSGTLVSLGMGLGAAVFAGVVIATLCTWLRVPGWAAGGAVGGAIGLWAGTAGDPSAFMLAELPDTGLMAAMAAAAGLSMFFGLIGSFHGVRDRLTPIREAPVGERHGRNGLVFFGVLLSSTLAGAAGVVGAWASVTPQGAVAMPDPILLSVVAVGAALLGGTSLLGRRGGVCGTAFAATLMLAFMWLTESRGWDFDAGWVGLGAIVAGFLVTRFVEAMNTPDENEIASSSRAGEVADLREDEPLAPQEPQDAVYEEYDEDLAAVGSGGDPWATTGAMPRVTDPFGASGAFDGLRGPGPGDGYETQGGARYDDADRRYLR